MCWLDSAWTDGPATPPVATQAPNTVSPVGWRTAEGLGSPLLAALPTVSTPPPDLTKSRTFTLIFKLAL